MPLTDEVFRPDKAITDEDARGERQLAPRVADALGGGVNELGDMMRFGGKTGPLRPRTGCRVFVKGGSRR